MSPFIPVIVAIGGLAALWMALRRPLWLFYFLIFVLLEPSRYLSLSSISLGSFSIKGYEIFLPLIYFAAYKHRKRALKDCVPIFMVLFFLMTVVSLLNGLKSGYGAGAFNYFRPYASMWIAVAIPLFFKTSDETDGLMRFFTVWATIFILVEMVALQTGIGYSFVYSPIRASYSSLLSDTSCSNMAFIFIYLFSMFDLEMKHAFLYLVLIGFSFICTVMSSARAVWLGMLVSIAGFFALGRVRSKIYLTLFSILGIIALFFLGSLYIARYDMTLAERLPTLLDTSEGTGHWRIMAWQQTLEDIKAHPLIGWPMGNEPLFYVESSGIFCTNATHNEFLKIARYTGLTGLFFFLCLMIQTLVNGFRYIVSSSGQEQRKMLALFLCVVYILVTSTFSQRITSIDICPFIWAIFGMVYLRLIEKKEQKGGLAQ
ncbi:O-antigen ligase family protein [bacterium]|nr:O-antigen ligase family protein [bacterium]